MRAETRGLGLLLLRGIAHFLILGSALFERLSYFCNLRWVKGWVEVVRGSWWYEAFYQHTAPLLYRSNSSLMEAMNFSFRDCVIANLRRRCGNPALPSFSVSINLFFIGQLPSIRPGSKCVTQWRTQLHHLKLMRRKLNVFTVCAKRWVRPLLWWLILLPCNAGKALYDVDFWWWRFSVGSSPYSAVNFS